MWWLLLEECRVIAVTRNYVITQHNAQYNTTQHKSQLCDNKTQLCSSYRAMWILQSALQLVMVTGSAHSSFVIWLNFCNSSFCIAVHRHLHEDIINIEVYDICTSTLLLSLPCIVETCLEPQEQRKGRGARPASMT